MAEKLYEQLKSYQQATVIYDFTVKFTEEYIKSYRTKEQMDQAARSGQQNIAEGSTLGKTSKKSEMKLLGVSRGSLEELLRDYETYLRQNSLQQWEQNSPQAMQVRKLVYEIIGDNKKEYSKSDSNIISYLSYSSYLNSAEQAANAMICLINQTNLLLDRQIASCKERFLEKGGFSESLYKDRMAAREKQIAQLDNEKFVPRDR